jgi:hypothetical protein
MQSTPVMRDIYVIRKQAHLFFIHYKKRKLQEKKEHLYSLLAKKLNEMRKKKRKEKISIKLLCTHHAAASTDATVC